MSYIGTRLLYGAHRIRANKVAVRRLFLPHYFRYVPFMSFHQYSVSLFFFLSSTLHCLQGLSNPGLRPELGFTKSCVMEPYQRNEENVFTV